MVILKRAKMHGGGRRTLIYLGLASIRAGGPVSCARLLRCIVSPTLSHVSISHGRAPSYRLSVHILIRFNIHLQNTDIKTLMSSSQCGLQHLFWFTAGRGVFVLNALIRHTGPFLRAFFCHCVRHTCESFSSSVTGACSLRGHNHDAQAVVPASLMVGIP